MPTEWHPCALCGARYRSRRAALRCCGDRFENDDDDDPQSVTCPDAHGAPLRADGGRDTTPAVGAVVTLATVDSQPRLLVTDVTIQTGTVTAVLLADLPVATIRQLQATVDDPQARAALVEGLSEYTTYHVPIDDLRWSGTRPDQRTSAGGARP